jgi:hypothetical protein
MTINDKDAKSNIIQFSKLKRKNPGRLLDVGMLLSEVENKLFLISNEIKKGEFPEAENFPEKEVLKKLKETRGLIESFCQKYL